MEMGDLISRKALRDLWLYNGLNEHIYCTNDVLDSIDEQPAVDAEPVRHSKWVCRIPGVFSCGACKGLAIGNRQTYYCPECGARMDGEARKQ